MEEKKNDFKLPPPPTKIIKNEKVPSIQTQKEVGKKIVIKDRPVIVPKVETPTPVKKEISKPIVKKEDKLPYTKAPEWAYWIFIPLAFILIVSLVIFMILAAGYSGEI